MTRERPSTGGSGIGPAGARPGFAVAAVALAAFFAARPAFAEDPPAESDEADEAYARVVARDRPSWLRAGIEEVLALSGGAVWYWVTPERQMADWDYPSWEQRLTFEAWRFDNNTFATNFVWHAFAGTGFHVIARSNDLGLPASLGLGLATSLAWEYLLEFREKVSVNDTIVSLGSGLAAGEFAHWLGRYLRSSPRRPAHDAARWTLGFWYALHDEMDGRPRPPPEGPTDSLGFSADIWHRFRVGSGLALAEPGAGRGSTRAARIRVDGELAAIPGYLAPGRMHRFFADGNVTRLRIVSALTGEDHPTWDFEADTTVIGYHLQDVAGDGTGHAATVGASIAYQYRREHLGAWTDRLGLMHLPGLALDGHLLGGACGVRLSVRAHPDFAGLEAAAYPAWNEAHVDAIEKTILRKQGYYFGWGVSGSLALEIDLPGFALGGSIFAGRYDSQEGLDRSQESVEIDVDAHDRVADQEAWLRLQPLPWPLHLEARYTRHSRESRVGGFHVDRTLHVYSLELGATF